jgi:hypothetical protein
VGVRLAPHGSTGAAALVPPGHRAVAVPVGPTGAPPLTEGDLVDVLAVSPLGPPPTEPSPPAEGDGESAPVAEGDADGPRDEPAFALVEHALVVAAGERSVSVAVPQADAPAVAFAVSQGAVVLALTGA